MKFFNLLLIFITFALSIEYSNGINNFDEEYYKASRSIFPPINVKPIHYWPFYGDTLDKAGDNHGTIIGGGFVNGMHDVPNTAFNFALNEDGIQLTKPLNIFEDSFTVSVWVNALRTDVSQMFGVIIGNMNMNDPNFIALEVGTYGKIKLHGAQNNPNITASYINNRSSRVIHKEWCMVSVVRDKENEKVNFYINDTLVYAYNNTINDIIQTIAPRIGRDGRTDTSSFIGLMSNFLIYKTALSDSNIEKLYLWGKTYPIKKPTDIVGCKIWLDASDLSNFTTTNYNEILTWKNLANKNDIWVSENTANEFDLPIFEICAVNEKPGINLNKNGTKISSTESYKIKSVFGVWKAISEAPNNLGGGFGIRNSDDGYRLSNGIDTWHPANKAKINYQDTNTFIRNIPFIMAGNQPFSVNWHNVNSRFSIGAYVYNSRYFPGYISEIIAFERELTEFEVDLVVEYLANKWKIETLPTEVPDSIVWLDAAQLNTVTRTNHQVLSWRNIINDDEFVDDSEDEFVPEIEYSSINGLPAINFSKWGVRVKSLEKYSPNQLFVVIKPIKHHSEGSWYTSICGSSVNLGTVSGQVLNRDTSQYGSAIYDSVRVNLRTDNNTTIPINNSYFITAYNPGYMIESNNLYIGTNPVNIKHYPVGPISEVIAFDRKLKKNEIIMIQNYLRKKYDIENDDDNYLTFQFIEEIPETITLGYSGPPNSDTAMYDSGDGIWNPYTSSTINIEGNYIRFKGDWRRNNSFSTLFKRTFSEDYPVTFFGSLPTDKKLITSWPTYAFNETFRASAGLSGEIPTDLFKYCGGNPVAAMFRYTFSGCYNLTGGLPSNLFKNFEGNISSGFFEMTFSSCTGLTGNIPAGLLFKINGETQNSMFRSAFDNCKNLSGIDEGWIGNIYGEPKSYMFHLAFKLFTINNSYSPRLLKDDNTYEFLYERWPINESHTAINGSLRTFSNTKYNDDENIPLNWKN